MTKSCGTCTVFHPLSLKPVDCGPCGFTHGFGSAEGTARLPPLQPLPPLLVHLSDAFGPYPIQHIGLFGNATEMDDDLPSIYEILRDPKRKAKRA